ncbi:MAG: HAD family hydrolase [Deltaproteobacteria bacterium]|nr:HAD family hydrolase [Deltaproteobacteria bacterium]MBW2110242.1 HAD family hydrolase [Deltaproteobacteria bacterium]MBW2351626.1 HAD family hydrolase [Deltaproteobacteria bacterium]
MKRPAVFIDRDGTINEQMGYINHISRFVLLPGSAEAIRLFNENGYLVVVVSNQSGVGRGYFPLELVNEVHDRMKTLLAGEGARVDGIFFCPHYPGGKLPEYSVSCECRKPGTGLIKMACESFDIDLENSYVIGDRSTDVELARNAGARGILVKTGYGRGDLEYVFPGLPFRPFHTADDLLEAARWIVEGTRHKA